MGTTKSLWKCQRRREQEDGASWLSKYSHPFKSKSNVLLHPNISKIEKKLTCNFMFRFCLEIFCSLSQCIQEKNNRSWEHFNFFLSCFFIHVKRRVLFFLIQRWANGHPDIIGIHSGIPNIFMT